MTEQLVEWFTTHLSGLPSDLIVFLLSMCPIMELRGGYLAASALGVDVLRAICICIIGNMLPMPFILLFIEKIFQWMKKFKIFRPMIEKMEEKALGEKSQRIRKYEFLGIILFVGIPLPGTGGWTGALIAALLHVKRKKALAAIFCGLILASTIMVLISYGIPWVISQI